MTIVDDFLILIGKIAERVDLPKIDEICLPSFLKTDIFSKKSNFGAIKLEDGAIGLVYINLSEDFKKNIINFDLTRFKEMNSYELAKNFRAKDSLLKTLGLGAINAISQHIFKRCGYNYDFTTDPLGLLNITTVDLVGMVGFFPPLVKLIKNIQAPLIIIEKKENLIRKTENWEVTLDPTRLKDCKKILITSTTVLNETIDEILKYCSSAEKISMIGPTAGFLPDPLFSRGIDIVGGTYIDKPNMFLDLYQKAEHWSPATKKYCIIKNQYEGYNSLLDRLI